MQVVLIVSCYLWKLWHWAQKRWYDISAGCDPINETYKTTAVSSIALIFQAIFIAASVISQTPLTVVSAVSRISLIHVFSLMSSRIGSIIWKKFRVLIRGPYRLVYEEKSQRQRFSCLCPFTRGTIVNRPYCESIYMFLILMLMIMLYQCYVING